MNQEQSGENCSVCNSVHYVKTKFTASACH